MLDWLVLGMGGKTAKSGYLYSHSVVSFDKKFHFASSASTQVYKEVPAAWQAVVVDWHPIHGLSAIS